MATETKAGVLDTLMKASIPILFTCVGWVTNSIIEHAERLAVIESSRYTSQDARRDREVMRQEVRAAMVVAAPPEWFRDQVAEIASGVRRLEDKVSAIDSRLARVEEK